MSDSRNEDKEEKKEHKEGDIPEAPPPPTEDEKKPMPVTNWDDLGPPLLLRVSGTNAPAREEFEDILKQIARNVAEAKFEEKYKVGEGHHLEFLKKEGVINQETIDEMHEMKKGHSNFRNIESQVFRDIIYVLDAHLFQKFGELESGQSIHKHLTRFSIALADTIGGPFTVQALNNMLELAKRKGAHGDNLLVLNTFIQTFEWGKKNDYSDKMSVWFASLATQLVSLCKKFNWKDKLIIPLSDTIIETLSIELGKKPSHNDEKRKGQSFFDQKDFKEVKETKEIKEDLIYNKILEFIKATDKFKDPNSVATALSDFIKEWKKDKVYLEYKNTLQSTRPKLGT